VTIEPGDWVRILDSPTYVGRVVGPWKERSAWVVVDYYDLVDRKRTVHRGAFVRRLLARVESEAEIVADFMLEVLEA
jgi:hypothetical protein